ncbi:MAG TPA: cyclic nucleotide-binding domain-containing protein [Planctomycetaceae bacterium]
MTATEGDLPNCVLFDSLTPPQRRELLELMEPVSYGPRSVILEEGKRTPGLWVITRGRCEVVKATGEGGRVLAELGPGAVFGEMSFLQGAPHSATVRSVTDVAALKLTPEKYERLERSGGRAAHEITRAIAVVLADRLRRMDDWTSRLLAQSPPEKKEEWAEFRAKLYNGWGF